MYPVQVMISYFTTSFTVIMHIGREVTAKQYTGGGLQDSKGTYIKNRPRNGCVLFHIDIKKDSVGIYCPFGHVRMKCAVCGKEFTPDPYYPAILRIYLQEVCQSPWNQ